MNNAKKAGLAVAALVMAGMLAVSGSGRTASGEPEPKWTGSLKAGNARGIELVNKATFPIQRAMAMALKQAKGGRIWKAELEVENGFLVYTIQVITPQGKALEVVIDANTRNILATGAGDLDELGAPGKEGK